MKIILIGPRATGKSTVAKILANTLSRPLFSTDQMLENYFGKNIFDYVNESGWDKFRHAETEICKQLASEREAIIDCGGGVPLRQENLDFLTANSTSLIVYLSVEAHEALRRLKISSPRPALSGLSSEAEWTTIAAQRHTTYLNAAQHFIDTTTRSAEDVAQQILVLLD